MTREEKLEKISVMALVQSLGIVVFMSIWGLFCAAADLWISFSSNAYLMAWGFTGGLFATGARQFFINLVTDVTGDERSAA